MMPQRQDLALSIWQYDRFPPINLKRRTVHAKSDAAWPLSEAAWQPSNTIAKISARRMSQYLTWMICPFEPGTARRSFYIQLFSWVS